MTLNVKKFNHFLFVPHCRLESIEDALNLIPEGCYFAPVDLKDGYYSLYVSIHEEFEKYLKMYCKNYFFKYMVLPNGSTPAVQSHDPPFKNLRSKGHLSVKYLDAPLLI